MAAITSWGEKVFQPVLALGQDSRLPVLATLVVIVLLAQSLAQLTWQLIPAPQLNQAELTAIVAPPVRNAAVTRPRQGRNISQLHLFGEVQKVAPQPVARAEAAPDTRLNLKLSGVLASEIPGQARAIIAAGGAREKTYRVGDTLPGNAVLREIYTDRVILETRGRLETLRLPKKSSGPAQASPPQAVNNRGQSSTVATSADATPAELLVQYQEALVSDPQSLMNLVRAVPVTDPESGELKGYRLAHAQDRSLLGKFGLRSGDVLTQVNGVAIDSPMKGLEILQSLTSATNVSITIERNGQPQSFSFSLDQN